MKLIEGPYTSAEIIKRYGIEKGKFRETIKKLPLVRGKVFTEPHLSKKSIVVFIHSVPSIMYLKSNLGLSYLTIDSFLM